MSNTMPANIALSSVFGWEYLLRLSMAWKQCPNTVLFPLLWLCAHWAASDDWFGCADTLAARRRYAGAECEFITPGPERTPPVQQTDIPVSQLLGTWVYVTFSLRLLNCEGNNTSEFLRPPSWGPTLNGEAQAGLDCPLGSFLDSRPHPSWPIRKIS